MKIFDLDDVIDRKIRYKEGERKKREGTDQELIGRFFMF